MKFDTTATWDGINWLIPDASSNSNDATSFSLAQSIRVSSNVLATQPVNGVSTTLPSTALQQSDLQFDSPYSNYSLSFDGTNSINCGTSLNSSLPKVDNVSPFFFLYSLSPKVFKDKVEKAGFFIGTLILTTKAETIKQSDYVLINNVSNNNTEVKIQVLDKGYVTEREFKKLLKSLKNVATYAFNNEDDLQHFFVEFEGLSIKEFIGTINK